MQSFGGQKKYYGRRVNGDRTIEHFPHTEWSRAMVEENIDHRNDRMMAQFFQETSPERLVNKQLQQQIVHNFPWSVLLSTVEMTSKC